MPADNELLNSTVAAESMTNDGNEFYIDAGTDPSAYWRAIPQRNLLQLTARPARVIVSRQLEPRLMQLLCLLVHAEGNVLTRDWLMNTLWPRVVVNENSLTRAVSELRKAFVLPAGCGIESAAPLSGSHLIETVPKRGYRLNATLISEPADLASGRASLAKHSVLSTPALSARSHWIQSITRRQALRYPAIAAAMVISAALSSIGTLKLTDIRDTEQSALVAQDGPVTTPARASATQQLEDRVLNNTSELPEGLHWLESVHIEPDKLNSLQTSHISGTVLAPGGQMMAFVEDFPGHSQLRLRSLISPDEAWTVFTSSSPITHLQWSPLDAGLLFTVQDKDGVGNMSIQEALANDSPSAARLSRLMLLDLETLQVRELYRRIVPASDDDMRTVGSLT